MKPDWEDAPEWANYLAMDDSGEYYWYERQPVALMYSWSAPSGRTALAKSATGWRLSLEERP